MRFDFLSQAAKFLQERKEYRRWLAAFLCLALAVVFGTVTALKMYGQAMTHQAKILDCQYEVHEHTENCYEENEDGERVLVCGLADYVIHVHNDDCYDQKGELVCPLEAHEPHVHTDSCLEEEKVLICGKEEVEDAAEEEENETADGETEETVETTDDSQETEGESGTDTETVKELACEKEEHTHEDSCYTEGAGCGKEAHIHDEACYEVTETLICEIEENHVHGDGCYTVKATEELDCGLEEHSHDDECGDDCEIEEHSHGDSCYKTAEELTCEVEENHTHGDGCYEVAETLICETEVHEHDDSCEAERELTCGVEEHEHDDSCYIETEVEKEKEEISEPAEKTEDEEPADKEKDTEDRETAEEGHIHTDDCYETKEEMTCSEQELHTHSDECYSEDCFDESGSLIEGSRVSCGLLQLEEHVHTEECFRINELTDEEVNDLNRGRMESVQAYKDGTLKVILMYDGRAGIPEDAELMVELVTEESDAGLYQGQLDMAKKLTEIQDNYEGILCDIHLRTDKEEVELQGTVNLEFQILADSLKEKSLVRTVSFEGEIPKELESNELTENEDGSLSTGFDSTSLGQFALLIENDGLSKEVHQKEFTQEYEDYTLKVIATYGEDAQIPEEAKLVVEAVTEALDEDSYREKTDAARELTGYCKASAELLYNVGFFVDGEEIEPEGTVTMEFQLYRDGIEAGEPVTVIHFGEDEPKVLESTDMSRNEDGSLSTSFNSDSFSPFMIIVGGEEVMLTGFISKDCRVYEQADYEANACDLSEYEPALEESIRIEVLETVTDAQGEEWYRYAAVTEDADLGEILNGYPYVPAKDVVLEGSYTRQSLTVTDDEGVVVTVEGLLPENAELTANRIYDPEIADIIDKMNGNLDGEGDFGDFRLVYDMDLGADQKLLEPVKVTVSNFDFSYDDYSNLSAWVYSMLSAQENEHSRDTSADGEEDELTAASAEKEVEKIDAEMKEDGAIVFETKRLAAFYIASTLIEGHDEYFGSLAEPGDVLRWEDIKDLVEEEELEEELKETEDTTEEEKEETVSSTRRLAQSRAAVPTNSSGQIVSSGGNSTVKDEVKSSKVISATSQENVFDITLKVQAPANTSQYYEDPNMAVVIVMDVSNTMTYKFSGNSTPANSSNSRYSAAIEAGKVLIDQFRVKCGGSSSKSRIGMVTFNTNARATFGLSKCTTAAEAKELKVKVNDGIEDIVTGKDYGKSDLRYTNIEAGLKRAEAMLANSDCENKYIILVTDGFPTTYIKEGYKGYVPVSSNSETADKAGIFRDREKGKSCVYGTNYSDRAAIKARQAATGIKNKGIKIYSVGVALGSQTIKGFVDDCKNENYSTVDRSAGITGTKFEIGSATSETAYKNWLKKEIGSNKYIDGTSKAALKTAFEDILDEIVQYHTKTEQTVLTVSDPVPSDLEFIGFYNNCNNSSAASVLQAQNKNLTGSHTGKGENTATVTSGNISWNLEKSGYTSSTSGNTTTYTYILKYRVRLKNEAGTFVENKTYVTNGKTTLTYKTSNTVNGKTTHSANKTIDFLIPSVKGYLSELEFEKIDLKDEIVEGAEFRLTHDKTNCKICRGNNTSVPDSMLKPFTAVSDKDGKVSFTKIPSGHQYILEETKAPEGYYLLGETYQVKVSYDTKTVTKINADKTTEPVNSLNWTVVNGNVYNLPETGGSGASDYTEAGIVLAFLASAFYLVHLRRKSMRKGE